MEKNTVKKKILELKKQKLLEVLNNFITKKKQKETGAIVLPNPNNNYRNIYLSYNNWQKKNPKDLPPLKSLWTDKNFQENKAKIIKNSSKN